MRVEHDEAINAGGDTAVWRRAILKGAQKAAELRLQLLFIQIEEAEDALLKSRRAIRMLPLPSSKPFATRSYCCARIAPGFVSISGMSSSKGITKG